MRDQHRSLVAPLTRGRIFINCIFFIFITITIRLFYWQVIKMDSLQAAAEAQYTRSVHLNGHRGEIKTADGHVLVTNEQVYRLFAQPHLLKESPQVIASKILPELSQEILTQSEATDEAIRKQIETKFEATLIEKLSDRNTKWVSLLSGISLETKEKIEALNIFAIGFDPYLERAYPEASMAAHITGFVGKDADGSDIGYFGIEGALEQELKARRSQETYITDALGVPIVPNTQLPTQFIGRTVTTTIERDLQYLAETHLADAVKKYGAKGGEIIIMDPISGSILALATNPSYDQKFFWKFPSEVYKNPSLTSLYEPGSTFKILTVAAGVDTGLISKKTQCPQCSAPWTYGEQVIHTWNDQYNANITSEDALAKSDNTAMIFIAEKLGSDRLRAYLEKFGIGQSLHLDLQEDTDTPFPEKWGPVETATISFGQGISVNSLQLLRAVGAVANDGTMMQPRIIKEVTDTSSGETIQLEPNVVAQVITADTARQVTEMLITAAQSGEAQWTQSKTHTVAGKTGTSQIAEEGGYASDRTIASYIGYAPPSDPKFLMLVKIEEPTTSPWAAETAAPTWYAIAQKLFIHFGIMPDR